MHFRTLGRTGLQVSLVSFGTGGPSGFGAPKEGDQPSRAALVRGALDLGINLFDTSAQYGDSERILGEALVGVPRDEYVLCTKWAPATWWSPGGVGGADGPVHENPEALTAGVEQSLQRLRTDVIDIMEFHGVRAAQYAQVVDRFYPVMQRLRESGKVRFAGLSERYIADPAHDAVTLALESDPEKWDVVSLKYGILNQFAARRTFPLALKAGTGVIDMSAVRSRLSQPAQLEALIADWKQRRLIPADSLPDRDPLGWLVHDSVDSVIAAGYRFAAQHPAVGTVLTGTTNIEHLRENVQTMENPAFPESDARRLQDLLGDIAEWA